MVITKEHYAAAKRHATPKVEGNHMVIEISEGNLVLPYADGLALLACLVNAERFTSNWSNRKLASLSMDSLQSKVLSHKDLLRYKMARLLDVDYDTLSAFEETLDKPEQTT